MNTKAVKTNHHRQRNVALLLGSCAVLLVASLPVVFREEIQARYRLWKLRGTPALLEDYLLSGDPPQALAARRFVTEAPGRQELFRLYLADYDRTEYEFGVLDHLRRGVTKQGFDAGSLMLGSISYAMTFSRGGRRRHGSSMGASPENPARRRLLLELLENCEGGVFEVEGFERLEFQVRRWVERHVEAPQWNGGGLLRWPAGPSGADHVCFFRIKPD